LSYPTNKQKTDSKHIAGESKSYSLTVRLKYFFMSADKDVEDSLTRRVEWTVSFDVRSTAAWRVFNVAVDPRQQRVHIQLHRTDTQTTFYLLLLVTSVIAGGCVGTSSISMTSVTHIGHQASLIIICNSTTV